MLCPHCGYGLDANQRACARCGFVILKSSPRDLPGEVPQFGQEGSSPEQQVSAHQAWRRNPNEAPAQDTPFYFKPNEQQRHGQSSSLRATRFTASPVAMSPLTQDELSGQTAAFSSLSTRPIIPATFPPGADPAEDEGALSAGSLLCHNRYRLIEKHKPQRWAHGAYETYWHAQDLLQGGIQVIICEMKLPGMKVIAEQVYLRTAMRALSSASWHSRVPALLDVFRDHERNFFVFQAIKGESLLARMQHNRRTLSEQEAIEICLQMTEILEELAQQKPPIVHGFVSPAHLMVTSGGLWFLTDFSIILACGAQQYLDYLDPSLLSPFTAPEFIQGMIDSRSDLYSLLATIYYGVSGKLPKGQDLNTYVSPPFNAILMKGLHPSASQRYQQPAALRQALLALRPADSSSLSMDEQTRRRNISTLAARQRQTISTSLPTSRQEQVTSTSTPAWRQEERNSTLGQQISQEKQPSAPVMQNAPTSLAQTLSSLTIPDEPGISETELLPRPEELPPLASGNDFLAATLWIVGALIFTLILVLLK